MKGSGGTEGGVAEFLIGLGIAGIAVYLFFDSVRMSAGGYGYVSRWLGAGHGGGWDTTSMGIVFIPFAIGVFALFVDASKRWAWIVAEIGLALIAVEILSRIRFIVDMKVSHFLIMLVLFLFGCALMFRSYRETHTVRGKPEKDGAEGG